MKKIIIFCIIFLSFLNAQATGTLQEGASCNTDAACRSGVCDSGIANAPPTCLRSNVPLRDVCLISRQCQFGGCWGFQCLVENNFPCQNNNDCVSGLCGVQGATPVCLATGLIENQACTEDRQCTYSTCVNGACGLRRLDAVCLNDAECASGVCLIGANEFGPTQTCAQSNIAAGQNCASDRQCQVGLVCVGNTCSVRLADGQTCREDRQCVSSICDPTSLVCVQGPLANRELCRSDAQCASGMCESVGILLRECVAGNLANGAPCASDRQCGQGGQCVQNQCVVQAAPQTDPNSIDQIGNSPYELARDWRVLSITFTIITAMLIALAYMFGHGFNVPELKAWASTEFVQIIVTALIVVMLVAVITFLDGLLVLTVNQSNLQGVSCTNSSNCAVTLADAYFTGLIDIAHGKARDVIEGISDAQVTASRRFGASAVPLILPIPLLQLSVSGTFSAGYLMDAERFTTVLESLVNTTSSMTAQQFFVNQISYRVAPFLLVVGIVARSFFATRRIGGLLIAIAVGVMYVLPLMFVVNWLTLNITLFGDSIITPPTGSCPVSCALSAPKFYAGNTPIYTERELYAYFDLLDPDRNPRTEDSMLSQIDPANNRPIIENIKRLARGEDAQYVNPNQNRNPGTLPSVSSCEFAARTLQDGYCPVECRELPYPLSFTCKNVTQDGTARTEITCNRMPSVCKITRYVNPADPYFTNPGANPQLSALYAEYQQYSALCPLQCRTIAPLQNDCSGDASRVSCPYAKDYCRFTRVDDLTSRPNECSARRCFGEDDCRRLAQELVRNPIGSCPTPVAQANNRPVATSSCLYVLPGEQRLTNNECNGCLFVPESYTFDPPLYRNCADICSTNASGPPKISPGEFAKRSAEGMVGRDEIKVASTLILPGYILPILNIVVTLMFIRSFSQIFGGDVEIPGLVKIL